MRNGKLHVGEWVEVRSKEEILKTLDRKGQLNGLPFMPQMFEFCGRRLRVFKRAHKTCDTVKTYKGRWMDSAVHLEGIRCDRQAYGGCQAACLIYWKEACGTLLARFLKLEGASGIGINFGNYPGRRLDRNQGGLQRESQ
jgi:hypothetical protein